MSAATAAKTVGYVIRGIVTGRRVEFEEGHAAFWRSNSPTVFTTVEAAIAAVVCYNQTGTLGPVTIEKVVEVSYTETKTEYHPL